MKAASESKSVSKGLGERVKEVLRADVAADRTLAEELMTDLVEKVEALEKRIAKLEGGA